MTKLIKLIFNFKNDIGGFESTLIKKS